jgi:hypothetical protein
MDHTTEARGGVGQVHVNLCVLKEMHKTIGGLIDDFLPLQLVAVMAADIACATAGEGARCCPWHGGWW